MQIQLIATTRLSLDPKLTWLWYSDATKAFIVGDEKASYAVPIDNPATATSLVPERPFNNDGQSPPRNLPIPAALYAEFAQMRWHGFRFLDASASELPVEGGKPPSGDLVRTLVFGPDYGHFVLHPPTGLVLALRGGSIQLLEPSDSGFIFLDKTKTRGRAALAFAAHPTEPLIAYGDNFGDFHAHRFAGTQFARSNKIAAKERKASRIEFLQNGGLLMIGGMGYLATYRYADGKFTPLHDTSTSVRDFVVTNDGEHVYVNQGMNGLTVYRYDASGFTKLAATKPGGAIQQIAVSMDRTRVAMTFQDDPTISVYAIA